MSKLHLVFGGRVKDPRGLEFVNLDEVDFVGLFDSYAEAEESWRSHAQRTVDDAEMKYVVVHLHRLLEPEVDAGASPDQAELSQAGRSQAERSQAER